MKPDGLILKRKRKGAKSTRTTSAGNKVNPDPESKSEVAGTHRTDATVSNAEDDKALTEKVRRILDEKTPPSRWERFSTNPLSTVLLTFLLSGILGGFLTYYLSVRQKELEIQHAVKQRDAEHQQHLYEEMNKIRLQKIGEVWEKLDITESQIDEILERIDRETGRPQSETQKDIQSVFGLVSEQASIIHQNRVWLGDEIYEQIKRYLDISGRYASERLLAPPGTDFTEALKKRAEAKQNIIQIMNVIISKEPGPAASPK